MRTALALVLLALAAPPAQAISNRKLLAMLRNVDAATVNGETADQIVARANGGVAAVLAGVYTRGNVAGMIPGHCTCVHVGCDNVAHFLVTCAGATQNNGTGYLTSIDNRLADGTPFCSACACTVGTLTSSVAVSATCLP